jgi:hypothetical protein
MELTSLKYWILNVDGKLGTGPRVSDKKILNQFYS